MLILSLCSVKAEEGQGQKRRVSEVALLRVSEVALLTYLDDLGIELNLAGRIS